MKNLSNEAADPVEGIAGTLKELGQPARDALFDLMWGAWFASRAPTMRQLVFAAVAGDEFWSLLAAQASSGDILKLMLLEGRLEASGTNPDAIAAIRGLQDGLLVMHLPPRLERIVKATDQERVRLARLVQLSLPGALNESALTDVAAVVSVLVEFEPSGDGAGLDRAAPAPAFVANVLSSLGLPPDRHDSLVDQWASIPA